MPLYLHLNSIFIHPSQRGIAILTPHHELNSPHLKASPCEPSTNFSSASHSDPCTLLIKTGVCWSEDGRAQKAAGSGMPWAFCLACSSLAGIPVSCDHRTSTQERQEQDAGLLGHVHHQMVHCAPVKSVVS